MGSPRGALLRRQEADPEIRVDAVLSRARFEQCIAQIRGALGEEPRPLPGNSSLRAGGALEGADDPGDVQPGILLPGDVETRDADALEVLPQRRPAKVEHAPEDSQVVRQGRRPGLLLPPPAAGRSGLLGRRRTDAQRQAEGVVADGRLRALAEPERARAWH